MNDTQAGIYKDYAKFKDVAANHWAAGYIGYCSNAELILGDGTNFYPDQTVTGYQALAMILRAVGYDKNNEFQGNGWGGDPHCFHRSGPGHPEEHQPGHPGHCCHS